MSDTFEPDEGPLEGEVIDPDSPHAYPRIFAVIVVIVGVVCLALLSYALLPGHVPAQPNPNWIDLIIDNRWVIWLLRMMSLAVVVMFSVFAVYFVRSIRHRMRKGHWLRSGAGLEAEIVSDALGDLEPVLASLSETEERANELEEQLSASNDVIQQLSDILNRFPESDVLAVIETIREENHPSEP